MQKYFCSMLLLAMITAITSTNCMDEKSLTTTKKDIIIELHLSEVSSKNYVELENVDFINQRNKYICSVLGIEWREGDFKYFVHKALFTNKECLGECWTKNHPTFLPLSKGINPIADSICNYELLHYIKAPSRLPKAFVESLQKNKDKSITLEPNTFQSPVAITFKLAYMKKCSNDTEGLRECCNEAIKGIEEKIDYEKEAIRFQHNLQQIGLQKKLNSIKLLLQFLGLIYMGNRLLQLGGLVNTEQIWTNLTLFLATLYALSLK